MCEEHGKGEEKSPHDRRRDIQTIENRNPALHQDADKEHHAGEAEGLYETERKILFLLQKCNDYKIKIHKPASVDTFKAKIQ